MGVQGTHSFLKKKGFFPEVVGSPQLKNLKTIHVDLSGSYYQMIINHFFQQIPSVAAKFILMKLGSIFIKEHTVLYLDGETTQEKQTAANRRRQTKERDSKKLESLLHVAEMKASQGKRVSASQIDAITRLSRRAFNITSPMKDTLVKTARQ
jgi:hypothetical protein